jgi:hypothetical protein
MMLPDEARFSSFVHDGHFVVLYQRGELNPFRSRWTRSDTGSEYLVVCPCGRGTHARYLDDAVAALRSSYILHDDGSHEHDESAFPCHIIEATQDGEHGFILGKIVVPELVDYFDLQPDSSRRANVSKSVSDFHTRSPANAASTALISLVIPSSASVFIPTSELATTFSAARHCAHSLGRRA